MSLSLNQLEGPRAESVPPTESQPPLVPKPGPLPTDSPCMSGEAITR
jgi:hypothetical protein